MKQLTKDDICKMDKIQVIKYYRPNWTFQECIYFLQKELSTMNPKPIDLLDKCNEILS